MTSMDRIPEQAQQNKGFVRYPMEWITPERIQRLGASGVTLLLVLISHANRDGVAWPSQERLAQYLGMSVRRIRQLISLLEQEGYIERTYARGRAVYRILAGGNQPEGEERKSISGEEMDFRGGNRFPVEERKSISGEEMDFRGSGNGFPGERKLISSELDKELDLKELDLTPPPIIPPHEARRVKEEGEEEVKTKKTEEEVKLPSSLSKRNNGASQNIPAARIGAIPIGAALASMGGGGHFRMPEPPEEMVRALKGAGIWERLASLRRYARDQRAWLEWLAGPLAAMWRSAPEAFPAAIGEALDALASRPEVKDPLSYLLAVARKRLTPNGEARGEEAPAARALRLLQTGQEPSDEDLVELLRQRGVPTKAGLGRYNGMSADGEWVYARVNGDIIAVSKREVVRRLMESGYEEVAANG